MSTTSSNHEGTERRPRAGSSRRARDPAGQRRLTRRRLTDEERNEEFRRTALPHLPRLYATASRYAWQPADADDLVQEALAKAYAAFDQFEPGTNAGAWLSRILVNTHHSQYAKRQRRPREVPFDGQEPSPTPGQADSPVEHEAFRRIVEPPVAAAMAKLPWHYRAVVYLVDVEGLRYAEAADALGVPVGTIMSRLHRGRRGLRSELDSCSA